VEAAGEGASCDINQTNKQTQHRQEGTPWGEQVQVHAKQWCAFNLTRHFDAECVCSYSSCKVFKKNTWITLFLSFHIECVQRSYR
jgi:hypothetical protein